VVKLVKFAVIVVVGEVDGDDLVDLVVFEQRAQRRVVEIAALDVVVAIDGDRLEVGDGGDAGEEGVHEDVETGVVDAFRISLTLKKCPCRWLRLVARMSQRTSFEMFGEQRGAARARRAAAICGNCPCRR
jgi:hypothetical protein